MPRRNNTKPHERYIGSQPDCSEKHAYRSQDAAKKSAELSMLEHPGVDLSVYRCENCRKWHLTSR